jgi:putative nucleotidyltransferase with HDIG domain
VVVPTREDAYSLLCEFNQSESLIKHALAVEGVMRFMARKRGEDEAVWGAVGLVHDLDYERYPEQHPHKAKEILAERGWPAEWIRAVMSHGWTLVTDVEPKSEMEKVLFAIDELTGLVTAAALVRPSRSVMDLSVKSLKKKWKDRAFAAGANREIIQQGAEMLGMELSDLFADVIDGMREVADSLGLGMSADAAESGTSEE